ncbi:MAG: chorismate-binding protein [Microscillaceae bacterium]|nr:chorismate-binding protein [Microscillaceae bacterium]MDW8461703.1 chorismate-binding protein [Cytophagales bacterium]
MKNAVLEKKIQLTTLWHTAIAQQKAVALCRLPNQTTQHLIIDFSPQVSKTKLPIESPQEQGFAISPFINPNNEHTYFIRADLYFQVQQGQAIWQDSYVQSRNYESINHFWQQIEHAPFTEGIEKIALHLPSITTGFALTENYLQAERYCQMVAKAIQAIERHEFQKVVLSRYKCKTITEKLNVIQLFETICQTYPTAFVYIWYIPYVGCWVGASPEVLISIDKNAIFRTVSLAGTQAYNPNVKLSKVSWTQKEIEEQALVSRYIINCFKKIRLREFQEEGPKTVVAGNLVHLKTTFEVDMQATNFPQLGSVMLDLLHPTSAVCGMPKEPALRFIRENENYDRSFYTGFVGMVNIAHETHLFVNLRCMQILHNKLIFYAGAGITEDSEPEKEWQETEMKCNTLLSVVERICPTTDSF